MQSILLVIPDDEQVGQNAIVDGHRWRQSFGSQKLVVFLKFLDLFGFQTAEFEALSKENLLYQLIDQAMLPVFLGLVVLQDHIQYLLLIGLKKHSKRLPELRLLNDMSIRISWFG